MQDSRLTKALACLDDARCGLSDAAEASFLIQDELLSRDDRKFLLRKAAREFEQMHTLVNDWIEQLQGMA